MKKIVYDRDQGIFRSESCIRQAKGFDELKCRIKTCLKVFPYHSYRFNFVSVEIFYFELDVIFRDSKGCFKSKVPCYVKAF